MIRRAAVPTAALCAAVLLAGCSAGTGTVPPAALPSAPPAGSDGSAPSPSPAGAVIEVRYEGGKVSGVDQRVAVDLGEQVVLRVTSDVAERVHVHGYDVDLDLVPGIPAEARFSATLAGSWEVELHQAGRPLFQLRVA
jgi:hypothetical protein